MKIPMQTLREIPSWYAKDKTKWSKTAPTRGKTKQQNIIKVLPGLKGPARLDPPTSPLEAWRLLIPDSMIEKMVTHKLKNKKHARSV